MQEFVLSTDQLQTVLNIAGLRPVDGAPLSQFSGSRLKVNSAEYFSLKRRKIVLDDANNLRINRAFLAGISPLCFPDEIITLQTASTVGYHGYARQSVLAAELRELPSGDLRFTFPFDWDRMRAAVASYADYHPLDQAPASSPRFIFGGSVAETIVLSLVTSQASAGDPVTLQRLADRLPRVMATPEYLQTYISLGLALELSTLVWDENSTARITQQLVERKYIVCRENHFYPTSNVAQTFDEPSTQQLTITRTLRSNASLISKRLHAAKMSRHVVVMSVDHSHPEPRVDWRAMTPESFPEYLTNVLDWNFCQGNSSRAESSPQEPATSTPKLAADASPVMSVQSNAFPTILSLCLLLMAATSAVFFGVTVLGQLITQSIWASPSLVTIGLLISTMNALVAVLCVKAATTKNLQSLRLAALIACIPAVTPWGILGIPVGAALLFTLSRSGSTDAQGRSASQREDIATSRDPEVVRSFPKALLLTLLMLTGTYVLLLLMYLLRVVELVDPGSLYHSFHALHDGIAFVDSLLPAHVLATCVLINMLLFIICYVAISQQKHTHLRYAALIACIPVISPWLVLGIPIGMMLFVQLPKAARST